MEVEVEMYLPCPWQIERCPYKVFVAETSLSLHLPSFFRFREQMVEIVAVCEVMPLLALQFCTGRIEETKLECSATFVVVMVEVGDDSH